MDAIERENSQLKGVLPKVYALQNLDPTSLGELINMIGNIALGVSTTTAATKKWNPGMLGVIININVPLP
ncbi:MAG: hypothetical protein ACK5MI_09975 [Mangrovibacterium sp.]